MATTTNFGWETPDDTDLVKDGAAAIRTALGGVDTSFVDLKGGTTGQVLSKASNTDLDYTWVTSDDANAIQNAIVDAKGDIITATAADTPARLAVGTNGQTLVADSSTSTGLKWATPAGGGKVLQVVSANITTDTTIASTTYTDTNLAATITPTLSTSKILVIFSSQVRLSSSSTSICELGLKLLRGATTVADLSLGTSSRALAVESGGASSIATSQYINYNYYDSPATTSATTYKLQAALPSTASGRSSRFQIQDMPSVMTLMEIGA